MAAVVMLGGMAVRFLWLVVVEIKQIKRSVDEHGDTAIRALERIEHIDRRVGRLELWHDSGLTERRGQAAHE